VIDEWRKKVGDAMEVPDRIWHLNNRMTLDKMEMMSEDGRSFTAKEHIEMFERYGEALGYIQKRNVNVNLNVDSLASRMAEARRNRLAAEPKSDTQDLTLISPPSGDSETGS
jgi:hypothetical protein